MGQDLSPLARVEDHIEIWQEKNPKPETGEGVTEWKEKLKAERRRLKNEWNEVPKVYRVDLERKIVIFVDQPHSKLLRYLRSLLSHDQKVIRLKIVDNTKEGGHKTKTIDLVGYPTVVFNSTRARGLWAHSFLCAPRDFMCGVKEIS